MTPRPRSAALLISVYLDEPDGAGWYAQLRGFDDTSTDEARVARVTGEGEVLAEVRHWLDKTLRGAPRKISGDVP